MGLQIIKIWIGLQDFTSEEFYGTVAHMAQTALGGLPCSGIWYPIESPLAEQAQDPCTNPVEMALPDNAEVVKSVVKADYAYLFNLAAKNRNSQKYRYCKHITFRPVVRSSYVPSS